MTRLASTAARHISGAGAPPGCRGTTPPRRPGAAGMPEHHRDRAPEDHVDAAPDLSARAVVVDVFFQLVTLGQDLTDGGCTEGHDRSGPIGRGLVAFADLGHPSSLGAARA